MLCFLVEVEKTLLDYVVAMHDHLLTIKWGYIRDTCNFSPQRVLSAKVNFSGQSIHLFESLKNNGLFCRLAHPFLDIFFLINAVNRFQYFGMVSIKPLLFIEIDVQRKKYPYSEPTPFWRQAPELGA